MVVRVDIDSRPNLGHSFGVPGGVFKLHVTACLILRNLHENELIALTFQPFLVECLFVGDNA